MDLQCVKMHVDSTLMQKQSDKGNVKTTKIHDTAISTYPQQLCCSVVLTVCTQARYAVVQLVSGRGILFPTGGQKNFQVFSFLILKTPKRHILW